MDLVFYFYLTLSQLRFSWKGLFYEIEQNPSIHPSINKSTITSAHVFLFMFLFRQRINYINNSATSSSLVSGDLFGFWLGFFELIDQLPYINKYKYKYKYTYTLF